MSILSSTRSARRIAGHGCRTMSTELPTSPCTRYKAITHPQTPSPGATPYIARAQKYQLPVYARPPFVLTRGNGSWLTDVDDRRYLDFTAGIAVCALGHADTGMAEVLEEQAKKLVHVSNAYHHEHAGELAQRIVLETISQGGLGWAPGSTEEADKGAQVFFTNSGTEANEGALKLVRSVGKSVGGPSKHRIACFAHAFHGRSMGALSVTTNTKYQAAYEPLVPGIDVGTLNDYEGLEKLITKDTCGVIVEPVQGEGGVRAAEEGWLKALRARCDAVAAVLIYDEIQCGLWRTGTLWAHSRMEVETHPDVVTMAKPLGNGFPIGAVLMRDSVAVAMSSVGAHGTTFGGSPLACKVGCHVFGRMSEPEFREKLRVSADYLDQRLRLIEKWFPSQISGLRGRGLLRGIAFHGGKESASRLMEQCRERGLLVLTAGDDAVRMVPPLNVAVSEVSQAMDVMESALAL